MNRKRGEAVMDSHPSDKYQELVDLLRPWLHEPDWAPISVLTTVLDSHLLFQEEGLAIGDVEPLFRVWWPDRSLFETMRQLQEKGLLTVGPGQRTRVSNGLIEPLASVLSTILGREELSLPRWSGSLAELLTAFDTYCLQELSGPRPAEGYPSVWGGAAYTSAGRTHLLLLRPFPLRLQAHPELYMLMICQLPQNGVSAITDPFIQHPSLRQRLALYDLDRGQKMNLTRSDLFIHFERFLRWTHGLRIVPSPQLTRSLVDAGLLVLEKA